jgi:hypothetical protein
MCLRLDLDPFQMTTDLDLADNLSHVTNWLSDYKKSHLGSDHLIEHRFYWGRPLGFPELSGTADLAVIGPDELVIADYKHGAGIIVDVETSKQLRLYLIGLIHKAGPRKQYRLVIFQPRGRSDLAPVREHVVTKKEIDDFAKEASDAATKNLNGTGKRKAGEHCKFCPAAPTCKALALFSLGVAVKEFSSFPVMR